MNRISYLDTSLKLSMYVDFLATFAEGDDGDNRQSKYEQTNTAYCNDVVSLSKSVSASNDIKIRNDGKNRK